MGLQKAAGIATVLGLVIAVISLTANRELREDIEHALFDVEKTALWESDSGWTGGGGPRNYCNAQLAARQKQYPSRTVELVEFSEQHKTERRPFKEDYYRYHCWFKDTWYE